MVVLCTFIADRREIVERMIKMARRKIELNSSSRGALIDMKTGKPLSEIPVICERIRYFREMKKMEQKFLAANIGVTANSVSNWENGRSRPDVNLLPAICRVLGISLYDLFETEAPEYEKIAARKRLVMNYENLSAGHRHAVDQMIEALMKAELAQNCPDLTLLTYFGKALAAGTGDPGEIDGDSEQVYVYSTPKVQRADYIFSVNGDSMEPEFHSGQDVLVQCLTGKGDLSPGEIGAFIVGNETYIKKYGQDGLYSLNPDYPVMHFDDETSVYLIGRVLGVLEPECYASREDIDRYLAVHLDRQTELFAGE